MLRSLLVRGMVVGVVAGVLAFAMGYVFGEPQVDSAIAFEELMAAKEAAPTPDATPAADAAAGQDMAGMSHEAEAGGEEELVSRGMQSTWGLLTGTVVYGAAFGGIFALVYAYSLGRFTGVSPRGLAGLLALAAFIAIIMAPFLKYPATPPAVGNPETIGPRTGLYLSMIVISIGAMVSSVLVGRGVARKNGAWTGALAGAALYIVIIAIAQTILPDIQEVPADYPALTLYRFRMANLGMHVVIWTTIGLLFGYFTERSLQAGRAVLRPAHS
jgi:predicted cobalt transporter CbtA